jgi:uncharacterized delta-60 repeat protein
MLHKSSSRVIIITLILISFAVFGVSAFWDREVEASSSAAQPMTQTDIVGPAGSGAFGTVVKTLPNGNIVVSDPGYDAPGPISNVGAVHMYSPTGTLISTITGRVAQDSIGGSGITVLANGNFLISSPVFDDFGANAGALTWCDGAVGCSGVVSSSNSLVGQLADDQVGQGGYVTALTNGNYVASTPGWNNIGAADAGAVTWCNGSTGCTGTVTTSNSLVGTTANDLVGEGGVTQLSNGNYVVSSILWGSTDVGAVTWCDGATGRTGTVSSGNSLVGTSTNDQIGSSQGIIPLANGNYVVETYLWGSSDLGAVTWCNGTTGCSGTVSSGNSLVGSTANDKVGNFGVIALTNGNYVVRSISWNGTVANVGAVTWCNGTTGRTGAVSTGNSLVGSTTGDGIGIFGIALTNGNYVVGAPYWNGTAADVGAVTWCSGATGCVGTVSSANSLVGSTTLDSVGSASSEGLKPLTNGNYVVASPSWDGSATDVGAVTWCDGGTGRIGTVSAANSLVGSTATDGIGNAITPLTNGNYVVGSSSWDGAAANVGAATLCSGATGRTGVVSAGNSLVGSTLNDHVGGGTVALANGNYVVASPDWNGAAADIGAITLGDGNSGIVGLVSTGNSLVGSAVGDRVGSSFAAALTNGNYVVQSSVFDNPAGSVSDAGAVTYGFGTGGTTGVPNLGNSVIGTTANGGNSLNYSFNYFNGTLVVGRPVGNIVTILTPGVAPTPTPTNTSTSTPTPTPTPCGGAGALDLGFNGTGTVLTSIGGNGDQGSAVAIQSDGRIVVAGVSFSGMNNDFAVVRYNTDGSLDTSFDGDGKVTTSFGTDSIVNSVAIQSDGKIVVAGGNFTGAAFDFAVVRYNANGSLDTSFDGDGKVTTPIGIDEMAQSVAIQSDGKIVVAGWTFNGGGAGGDVALVRYNTNGSLDTTFNTTGKVVTPVGSNDDGANSVKIQPDGKIVAAGYSINASSNTDFAVVRYNTNGSLDTSFNGTGKVTTPVLSSDDNASSAALQSDGKIVVAGRSSNGANFDFALVRYNTGGSLDTSFDGDGKVTTPIGSGFDEASSVAIQPDGKIVAAGSSNNGSSFDFALARYNVNGGLDTSFNNTGKVTTPVGSNDDRALSVALQADGKIVAAGVANNGAGDNFAVARYGYTCPAGTATNTATPTATNSATATATATATPGTPEITVNPTSFYFGSQRVSTLGAYVPMTMTNTGTATLPNFSMTFMGDHGNNFMMSSNPSGSVPPGGSVQFEVRFGPTGFGTRTAILRIGTSDPNVTPREIALSGTGESNDLALISPAAPTSFGSVALGLNSSPVIFTVRNNRASTMTLGTPTLANGSEFSIVTALSATSLAPNATATFSLRFTPLATGFRSDSISIQGSGDPLPLTVSLYGNGTPGSSPTPTITPSNTVTPTNTSTPTPTPCPPFTLANPTNIGFTSGPGGNTAAPYPSSISVSGLSGTVSKVTVKLNGFANQIPDEINMMIVGPGGQNAIIMSNVGGSTNVSNLTLTLDDAAAASMPDNGPLVTGTFKPTNVGAGPSFPAPAPAPSGGSALSVFNGAAPNGTWSLYTFDEVGFSGFGNLVNGWELNIVTTSGPCPTATATNTGTATSTATSTATATATSTPPVDFVGLTSSGALVTFNSAAPGTMSSPVAITGLIAGDVIVGIDMRPVDAVLIGLGYNAPTGAAHVYSINASTGAATSINANSINVGANEGRITIDFDPVSNYLRIVTTDSFGNNLHIPTGGTGSLVFDSNLSSPGGIAATAYSRNLAGGGSGGSTTLYEINASANSLATQGSIDFTPSSGTNPNVGTVNNVAALTGVSAVSVVGFDIHNAAGTAGSSPGSAFVATASTFYSLNLNTGTATSLGTFAGGVTIKDVAAVLPAPPILLLDTVTSADSVAVSSGTPRSYMGNAWTNNTLPAGTGSVQVTSLLLYVTSTTMQSYTNLQVRIQFWNTYASGSTPVFSSAAGPTLTFAVGPQNLGPSTYQVAVTLPTPITLVGGPGTSWGFSQNWQGNTGGGMVDTPNLTSAITSNSGGTYAAGQITNGTSPVFGFYRAGSRTDNNFDPADLRTLGNLPEPSAQAVGIKIYGYALSPTPTPTNTPTASPTPTSTFTATPTPFCTPSVPLNETFESGTLGTFTSVVPTCAPGGCGWASVTTAAHAGTRSAFAPDLSGVSDQQLTLTSPVSVPANPMSATLTFWHRFSLLNLHDGGVLETSINGGSSWQDAGVHITAGGYNGTILSGLGSPIAGRMAWTGNPNGTNFVQVTVSLLSFAGQNVLFRFREANDNDPNIRTTPGWWVDDVRVDTDACPTQSVSGTITYGNAIGNPPAPRFVKNVSVASTAGSPAVGPVITGTSGSYVLTGFGAGSYTIRPTKPGGPNAAINSFDAARVAQGVAGSVPFVSQNQRFVSDSSGNGSVTSNDAALIAKFAAGLGGAGNAGQWKFFVTGAPSPLPTAPQTYNDSRTYASVMNNIMGENYVAVLIGEASGNYNTSTNPRPARTVGSGRMSDVGENGRAAEESITVTAQPALTEADKVILIPVSVEGVKGKDIISYEFNLRYDPTVIQPLENSADLAGTVSRGLMVVTNPYEPGLLRVVVYGSMPIEEDGVLLNLRFTAVGPAGSISPLTFERMLFNDGAPRVSAADGMVELF